ncbi:MAG: hypothetical protein ACRDLS_04500 [Solirubrobacteraceae bacterium]
MPPTARVFRSPTFLTRIANEVNDRVRPDGKPPAPSVPDEQAVDVGQLSDDS